MSWICTATGRRVDLHMPMPAQIDIMDIAWHLAQKPRFSGACRRPFSGAEHSLLVCEIVEREYSDLPHLLLRALMHDAHEAYTGDMHTPGKQVIGNAWYDFERRFENIVALRFDLRRELGYGPVIKHADLQALATERRDLMPQRGPGSDPWDCLRGIEPVSWVQLNSPDLAQHDWEFWRDRFLDKFHELDFARQQLDQGCSRHDAPLLGTALLSAPLQG
jgi:hypothetical protein